MEGSCKDCTNWAEEIYWTHFQTVHFSQFLLSGYDQQLAIPKKFVDSLRKKLPGSVVLKGPSGLTWNVGIKTSDDTLFFNHGWQAFVKDHSLKENDFLIFRYNGAQFDVLVFDGENLCEKEASYFVRKCGHTEHDNGCLNKRKLGEDSIDDIQPSSNKDVGGSSPGESINGDTVLVPSGQHIISVGTTKRTRRKAASARSIPAAQSPGTKELATRGEGVKRMPGDDAEHTPMSMGGALSQQYMSHRRAITEDEKKNALHLAQEASSDETFLVVMRPTHVYKRFFVWIPSEWLTKHLSKENQEIILRVQKNTWRARYNYNRARGYGGITGGWKHFAVDNNLEEFDVCLFKPAGHTNASIILDVSIFRVVQQISPVAQVPSPTPRRGRRKVIKYTEA